MRISFLFYSIFTLWACSPLPKEQEEIPKTGMVQEARTIVFLDTAAIKVHKPDEQFVYGKVYGETLGFLSYVNQALSLYSMKGDSLLWFGKRLQNGDNYSIAGETPTISDFCMVGDTLIALDKWGYLWKPQWRTDKPFLKLQTKDYFDNASILFEYWPQKEWFIISRYSGKEMYDRKLPLFYVFDKEGELLHHFGRMPLRYKNRRFLFPTGSPYVADFQNGKVYYAFNDEPKVYVYEIMTQDSRNFELPAGSFKEDTLRLWPDALSAYKLATSSTQEKLQLYNDGYAMLRVNKSNPNEVYAQLYAFNRDTVYAEESKVQPSRIKTLMYHDRSSGSYSEKLLPSASLMVKSDRFFKQHLVKRDSLGEYTFISFMLN